LVETCPHPDCRAALPVLASRFRPGYCSKCSGWLGITTNHPTPSWTAEQWQWHVWGAEAIGELISHNGLKAAPHLRNIPELIAASRKQAADGSLQKLAKRLQLSRRTLDAWRSGKQIPQIESLMRLCYFCGVSLYELFTAQPGTLDLSKMRFHSLPNIPNPAGKRRRRTRFDAIRIQLYLEAVLTQEEPPPSMRVVAKRLNYSPRELRSHFPGLCRAISTRRKDYFKTLREQLLRQRKEEVRKAIIQIRAQGLYPSSHNVSTLLSNPAAMRDRSVYRYWRESIQEL